MFDMLLVGLGGFFGSAARYVVTKAAEGWFGGFPLGTLIVNVSSALFIGFILGISQHGCPLDERMRLFLVVGVLGGFSTFSAFSSETLSLFQDGDWMLALGNIVLNIALTLAFVTLGWWVSSWCHLR
jgi:CrcB protein